MHLKAISASSMHFQEIAQVSSAEGISKAILGLQRIAPALGLALSFVGHLLVLIRFARSFHEETISKPFAIILMGLSLACLMAQGVLAISLGISLPLALFGVPSWISFCLPEEWFKVRALSPSSSSCLTSQIGLEPSISSEVLSQEREISAKKKMQSCAVRDPPLIMKAVSEEAFSSDSDPTSLEPEKRGEQVSLEMKTQQFERQKDASMGEGPPFIPPSMGESLGKIRVRRETPAGVLSSSPLKKSGKPKTSEDPDLKKMWEDLLKELDIA